MFNNTLKKRFFLILSSLLIIIILYLFPTKKDEIKVTEIKAKEEVLYLLDNNNYVSRVTLYLKETEVEKKVKEILEYLTINSKKHPLIKEGFTPIIPKNTKVLSISIDKDLIKVNFSKELLNIKEEDENNLISSIIYSLTSIEGINKVSIYIDGNILNKLPNSNKQLSPILDRSYGINKIYDFTKIKGTNKTTIYYLSKYNDYYYYTPVTMINNENKDKIEIIIEELSSKKVYQTNFISYLKSSKEISFEEKNDTIFFKLNSDAFNLNNEEVLESIIYTINLSLKDNYQNKKVIYYVDNYIYKSYFL